MTMCDYRIVRTTFPSGDMELVISEVFFDENGNPEGWNPVEIFGDSCVYLSAVLNKLSSVFEKPIIDSAEFVR